VDGKVLRGRRCHDLSYESSQKSGTVFYKNLMKPLRTLEAAVLLSTTSRLTASNSGTITRLEKHSIRESPGSSMID
jgi:hypothetical protein